VSFRITPKQAEELERLINRGMNPSSEFRNALDSMMNNAKRRRFY